MAKHSIEKGAGTGIAQPMRAMILAAGRGERMRPLTDHTPKPLLKAGGKPLIVWHLERLAKAGFSEIVINYAHLGEQFPKTLGDGRQWGLKIFYSPEPLGALETAGGIAHALPLLGDAPFLALNGDIFCDWDLALAKSINMSGKLAHLVLVDNPAHHPQGDFALMGGNIRAIGEKMEAKNAPVLTFSGIGIYAPALFKGLQKDKPARLGVLLHEAIDGGLIFGEHHKGRWIDIGTPERLRQLEEELNLKK